MVTNVRGVQLPNGEEVTVVAYKPHFVDDTKSSVVVILGYGGRRSAPYKKFLQGTADHLRVVVYVVEYGNRPDISVNNIHGGVLENPYQKWKQFLVQTVLRHIAVMSPTGKVTLFGYSEGAIHAVLAASEEVALVDHVVLIAGAGYCGKETILSIGLRAARNYIDRRMVKLFGGRNAGERLREYEAAIKEYQKVYFGHLPFVKRHWCALQDAINPGRVDVTHQLFYLLHKKCPVSFFLFTKDKMIDSRKVRYRFEHAHGSRIVFLTGIHSEILTNPEPTIVAIGARSY